MLIVKIKVFHVKTGSKKINISFKQNNKTKDMTKA